jgi:hypothetical protein
MKPHLATETENSGKDFQVIKRKAEKECFPRLSGKTNFFCRDIVIGDFALIAIATEE